MDSTSRRPQLPALSYLDVDNVKREEESYASRSAIGTPNHSATAASPTYHHYSSGPPYTQTAPQHASTWPGVHSSVHTPPASRRTSGDEQENTKQTTRHSLPSISEALGPVGLDAQGQYPHVNSNSQPPPPPAQPPVSQTSAPCSPPSAARRSFPMEPPPSQSHAHFPSYRQDSAGPNYTYTSPDTARPPYRSQLDGRPAPTAHAEQPPRSQPATTYTQTQTTSPSYERAPAEPTNAMPPPGSSNFSYGYQSYPSQRYSQTGANGSSGPIYQPSTQYPAPPTPATPSWKADNAPNRYPDERSAVPPYGESVKRRLDAYDFEEALNDIGKSSNVLADFARRYGERMHQNARGGVSPSTLPTLVEMDEMIHKAGLQMDSLSKVREMILAQHAVYEQQIADQRHKAFAEPQLPPPTPEHLNEEMKGGFAAGETKKRRGRAAAPGRCHSCQRSETPEWRRGPDGARTLCNACGLHFAKMTRKQQTAAGGQNGAVQQSSNLRPKEG